ncbi:MAG: hypothetical protein MUE82_12935 [Chloroflexi bacterium]|jgi:hypothetical protein|nr:hypothetical protein [Chloroflexota bacterium]
MATKADFSADEWKQLHMGVSGAGMLVSMADRDVSDSFGEATALAKYLAGQTVAAPTQLMREIAGVHSTGFGLFATPAKIHDETMAAIAAALAALSAKAPEEIGPYQDLALGAAEAAANAKGGTAPGEKAMLDQLRAALGAGG